MRKIDEIIIHCTATPPNWMLDSSAGERVLEVKRWHVQDNGWSDIGYHFLIDRAGEFIPGRPIERPGAHTKGHNANSIGIALFGGKGSTASDDFYDNFTEDQEKELRKLIDQLRNEYDITKISGHNQFSAKACPGFSVPKWYAKKGNQEVGPLVKTPRKGLLQIILELFGVKK